MYDQLLFAPIFTAVLLITIGICQGKNIEKLKIKIQNEYSDILMNNYKVMNHIYISYKFSFICFVTLLFYFSFGQWYNL